MSASACATARSLTARIVNQPSPIAPSTISIPNTASTPAIELERSTDAIARDVRLSSSARSRAMSRSSVRLIAISVGALRPW
jgi:hypothetical protein